MCQSSGDLSYRQIRSGVHLFPRRSSIITSKSAGLPPILTKSLGGYGHAMQASSKPYSGRHVFHNLGFLPPGWPIPTSTRPILLLRVEANDQPLTAGLESVTVAQEPSDVAPVERRRRLQFIRTCAVRCGPRAATLPRTLIWSCTAVKFDPAMASADMPSVANRGQDGRSLRAETIIRLFATILLLSGFQRASRLSLGFSFRVGGHSREDVFVNSEGSFVLTCLWLGSVHVQFFRAFRFGIVQPWRFLQTRGPCIWHCSYKGQAQESRRA